VRSGIAQRAIKRSTINDKAAPPAPTQEIIGLELWNTPLAANTKTQARNTGIVHQRRQRERTQDLAPGGWQDFEPVDQSPTWIDDHNSLPPHCEQPRNSCPRRPSAGHQHIRVSAILQQGQISP
jgi:hypothetical protein